MDMKDDNVNLIKFISIISIIVIHNFADVVLQYGRISNNDWQIFNILDSIIKMFVPLFIIPSGILLLTKDELKNY